MQHERDNLQCTLFIQAFKNNQSPVINGDGSFSRDFTFVENAVQANILALFTEKAEAVNQVYNIACGYSSNLNDLVANLRDISGKTIKAVHGPNRVGDIPHSLADITRARTILGYKPDTLFRDGLERTWSFSVNLK